MKISFAAIILLLLFQFLSGCVSKSVHESCEPTVSGSDFVCTDSRINWK